VKKYKKYCFVSKPERLHSVHCSWKLGPNCGLFDLLDWSLESNIEAKSQTF